VSVSPKALAPLQHGGRSTVALAPTVRGVKRELCKRLGVRYADLTATGREAVDLYAPSRAKLAGRRGLLFPLDELEAFEDGASLETVNLGGGGRVCRPVTTDA
jgi:hypothetical protein